MSKETELRAEHDAKLAELSPEVRALINREVRIQSIASLMHKRDKTIAEHKDAVVVARSIVFDGVTETI